jgi:hypothetical protein
MWQGLAKKQIASQPPTARPDDEKLFIKSSLTIH